ncbi:MAG: hypothetical protein C0506_12155 [Anaerolinea sp.]|nr:hypothetical protein [Anaerolinea sp.]
MSDPALAPAITFTAVESKRKIDLADVRVPTVLMLVSQATSEAVDPIVEAVRGKYPDIGQVLTATAVDLRSVPRLVRKVAETMLSARYKQRAAALEPGRDPREWVVIIPDWDAKAMKALGIEDVSQQLAVAVLAPGGKLVGTYQGAGAPAAVLEMLARA